MATALDGLGRQIASIEPAAASAAVGDVRQELTPKLAKLVVGQQLRGEIISKLNDGSFTVKVAGFTAKMILPKEFVQGDSVPLRLISIQPRPTFLLDQQENTNRPTNSSDAAIAQESDDATTPTTLRRNGSSLPTSAETRSTTPNKPADNDVILHLTDTGKPGVPQQSVSQRTEQQSALTRSYANETHGSGNAQAIQLAPLQEHETQQQTRLADGTLLSAPTVLSQAAKMISQVLSAYAGETTTSQVLASKPVVENPAQLQQTTELAQHLQKQIAQSGLFYESHLAQWADGKLSLHELAQEPQQQLRQNSELLTPTQTPQSTLTESGGLNQLMNSQLQLLEQQKLQWRGELFPGQKMEWEIERDKQGNAQTESGGPQVWYSSVRFELPNLGTIEAKLNLAGNQLGLSINAHDPTAVALLKSQKSLLSENLQSSGTDLTSFNAKLNEQT